MELGDKLKSVSTGEIFTVEEINEKFSQVIVVGEDGKSKAYSATTLKDKRRFVPVKEEKPTEDDMVSAEDLEKALMAKALAPKASGKKRASKTSGELIGVGADIKDYAVATAKKLGAEICESNGRFISFKVNNKMFAAIFSYSKKSLTLGVRGKSIEGKTNPDSTANHMMDARFKFDTLTDNVKELIRLILESAFEYQSNLKK